ncbi:putative lipid II flippase MurJ [Alphaproteobacteria bacterium]|nr:putative lipid II flippase MurJ [Alphaproteobacteria bacterium]
MGIIRAAFTVGSFTLLSRIIGFLRECVMAFTLGAGMYTDAILVALRLANTFRRIFAEGAFNASFLPRFSKILARQAFSASPSSERYARCACEVDAASKSVNAYGTANVTLDPSTYTETASSSKIVPAYNAEGSDSTNACAARTLADVFSALVWATLLFCAVVLIFFPSILSVFVSGFDVLSEKFKLTVVLGRICFPYLILISIASLFGGVLNSINKFALPSAVHSVMSLFTMIALLIGYTCELSSHVTVHLVAVFTLLSGVAQSYILYVSIRKYGFRVSLRLNCLTEPVKDIMKNMVPGIIGAGVWQLNVLMDATVSSYLPTGTITCINLADRLNQFPLGTLGIALSTALLPTLSKYIAVKDYDKASAELERGILFAFFLTLFATVMLVALSEPTVAVAFQRGQFQEEHVKITASTLIGFAVGLPAFVLTKIFSALYFACGDTKSPVIFGACSVFINAILIVLLVPIWKYLGLALCTSIAALSNAIMLICFSSRHMKIKLSPSFFIKISSQFFAALVTYFVLRYISNAFWTPEIGNHAIKWLIYLGFSLAAAITFFSTTVLCLLLSIQKEWKIWKH